jgi:hypothetical protein
LQNLASNINYSVIDLSDSTCSTWSSPLTEKPFRRTHGPAHQASYACAKNDPIKQTAKQQKTNQTVEWLIVELQKCLGYTEFCDSFHQIRHNPAMVRSWMFADDFINEYNKLTLVVSALMNFSH